MRALALLLLSLPSLAAPRCPTADAVSAYRQARELLDEGDAQRAVELLSQARAACPAAALDFYLAIAHERLRRLRPALDALHKYLAEAGEVGNRAAVEEWVRELEARAAAEEQGLPPPALPARATPGPPPPYANDVAPVEPVEKARPRLGPAGERWTLFGAVGFAGNARLQPGVLSSHLGAVGDYGGAWSLGVGYRVAERARLDVQVVFAGQVFPWTRADLPSTRNLLFATLIGAGLRLDLPLVRRGRASIVVTPSAAVGLGSLSVNTDPSYVNALGLHFAFALALETGALGLYVEPQALVLLAGDLATLPTQATVGATLGARIRF